MNSQFADHPTLDAKFINMTTSNVFSVNSLQTDPDLYALRNKKYKKHHVAPIVTAPLPPAPATTTAATVQPPPPQPIQSTQSSQLVSTNRLAYVEALVDINAVVIESIWYPTIPKESRVSPVVPLRTFIQEVLKRSRTTYSTLQTALFYLFRARPAITQHLQQQQQRSCDKKSSWQHNAYISCGRRMFLASLVVASKFVQDKTYRNSAWAKIAGLPVTEINTAERYFLSIMDHRLYIDQSTFDRWHRLLHTRTQARMHNIPTSLRDLSSCLSFSPTTSYPSPNINSAYNTNSNDLLPSYISTPPLSSPTVSTCSSTACGCSQCSPISVPPALSLSLPSSISSSPAQTPTQVSPVRMNASQKRKYDSREHIALLDKKHCRFWQ
ncbi:cyclin [Mucor lusitanicus]|uniref:Cyclin n=2 Tax=Mucor circinelloides f. lusitanicus TaxID=29924 RepID=A0A162TDS9_MUCCL|nr:cyclin-domain-containing protein [Mucor lusitanicus]OAD03822.1 cyclin [Mucor lusitanicus CBS 277.49]